MLELKKLLKILVNSPIDFVLVGGFAAVLHGCNQSTQDLDICMVITEEKRLLLHDVLQSLHPRWRTAQSRPFTGNETEGDLYLETDLGVLDVISRVEAIGDYYSVLKNSVVFNLFGSVCHVISIDDLIKTKEALGRHRDLAVVEELRVIKKLS